MSHTSKFHGPIAGRTVIPGTHTAAGGTTNFHFNHPLAPDHLVQARKPFSTVPFAPDPDLVNRPTVAAWVRQKCAGPGARAALVGLGGVGKSQLAIQYAHSIRDTAPQTFVFWVHASTKARFKEGYQDIADQLQLLGRDDQKVNVLRLVYNWLRDETNGQWVMIVDSADDMETFFPSQNHQRDDVSGGPPTSLATYLPQSRNGAILVTSRSMDVASRLVGGHNKINEVSTMGENEGLQLLFNKLKNPPTEQSVEEKCRELLHALECIPLAITQAAAYINKRAGMTVASYLDTFWRNDRRRESLLNWNACELRRDESASNSVVTTWQMSFEKIRRERRSAAELLSLISFFNPQGIPESTLRQYNRNAAKAATTKEMEDADRAFDEDLDILQGYCFVSMADSDTWKTHALVQFCTRVWLSSFGDAAQWEQKFVALMAQELPNGKYENWKKCQQLFPHVESLVDAEPVSEDRLQPWVQVLINMASYLRSREHYNRAQQIAAKAFAVVKRELGKENKLTLLSADVLALALHDQGKNMEAETLHRQILEGWERLASQQRQRLLTMSKLANVVQDQGRYEEAEMLHRQALEGLKEMLGEWHIDTLTCLDSLAGVLEAQGKYEEAEILTRRALDGTRKKKREDHPSVLTSLGNLASVLTYQGKHREAEKLRKQELEGRKKILGEQDPKTLATMLNLARVLFDQGKYEDAEPLSRQALKGREVVLGKQHPTTLTTMHFLAKVLEAQDRYSEAGILYQQVLEEDKKVLPEQHPDTLTTMHNLARVLEAQGKNSEAETFNRRALEGREKALGEQDLKTLATMHNLSRVLEAQGKDVEAEILRQREIEGRRHLTSER